MSETKSPISDQETADLAYENLKVCLFLVSIRSYMVIKKGYNRILMWWPMASGVWMNLI